jgi:hypothetical protein
MQEAISGQGTDCFGVLIQEQRDPCSLALLGAFTTKGERVGGKKGETVRQRKNIKKKVSNVR